jgi:hypothetical protein
LCEIPAVSTANGGGERRGKGGLSYYVSAFDNPPSFFEGLLPDSAAWRRSIYEYYSISINNLAKEFLLECTTFQSIEGDG